jgi:hypothetical protein
MGSEKRQSCLDCSPITFLEFDDEGSAYCPRCETQYRVEENEQGHTRFYPEGEDVSVIMQRMQKIKNFQESQEKRNEH